MPSPQSLGSFLVPERGEWCFSSRSGMYPSPKIDFSHMNRCMGGPNLLSSPPDVGYYPMIANGSEK